MPQDSGLDTPWAVSLGFKEAALGGKKSFTTTAPGACEASQGTGSADGRPHPCPTCNGSGHVSQRSRKTKRFFSVTSACPGCHGSGIDPATACPRCRGSRIQTRPRTIEVSIPPAVADGTILRLRQMGAPGRQGGPAGDLRIHIRIQPGGPFEREGLNLKREVTVDLLTAVLGGKLIVQLLEGKAEMTIPPGTQAGQHFRLAGQGLFDGVHRGDLIVAAKIMIPTQPSDEERQLYEKLRSAGTRS